MIIICGATIAEVERDLEMAKQAIASGMPYGVGGATIEDAEMALEMMRSMGLPSPAPISNPNYTPDVWEEEEEEECYDEEPVAEPTDIKAGFIEWLEQMSMPDELIDLAKQML